MHNLIKQIILDSRNNISVENCFDSHLIIQLLIEQYSDEYLQFASKYAGIGVTGITTTTHSQIAFQIKELTKGDYAIFEQCECKVVSFNIHHVLSENTLWRRIK